MGLVIACASPALAQQTDPNATPAGVGAPAPGPQKKSTLEKATAVAGSLAAIMAAYKAAKSGAPQATAVATAPTAAPAATAASSPALGTSLLSK